MLIEGVVIDDAVPADARVSGGCGLHLVDDRLRAGIAVADEMKLPVELGVAVGDLTQGSEQAAVVFSGLEGGHAEDAQWRARRRRQRGDRGAWRGGELTRYPAVAQLCADGEVLLIPEGAQLVLGISGNRQHAVALGQTAHVGGVVVADGGVGDPLRMGDGDGVIKDGGNAQAQGAGLAAALRTLALEHNFALQQPAAAQSTADHAAQAQAAVRQRTGQGIVRGDGIGAAVGGEVVVFGLGGQHVGLQVFVPGDEQRPAKVLQFAAQAANDTCNPGVGGVAQAGAGVHHELRPVGVSRRDDVGERGLVSRERVVPGEAGAKAGDGVLPLFGLEPGA